MHEERSMTDHRIVLSRRAFAGAAVTLAICPAAPLLAADYTVNMSQMRYGPLPANLKVGDRIVWVNKDTVAHTVTARDRSFDIRIDVGRQATQTLTKAGSFPFYCIWHPAMRGTLTVAAA
jgi:plastocyanin